MIRYALPVALLVTATAYADFDISQVKVGEKISGTVVIGKNTFPIPEGEWELANVATWDLNVCGGDCTVGHKQKFDDMKTVQLIKTIHGKLSETLVIESPVNNTALLGKQNTTSCDVKTGYYYTDFDSGYNLPECLRIHHGVNFYTKGNLNKFHSTTKLYFDKNKIEIPRTTIETLYYYASKFGGTTVRYAFNPEVLEFAPSTISNWDVNEWHKNNQNQQQKEFTNRAVEWSKQMAEVMQKALKNKEITKLHDLIDQEIKSKTKMPI